MSWKNVNEEMPGSQVTVLAYVPEYGNGVSRRVRAFWLEPMTLECNPDYDDAFDCDESDDGTLYVKGGWYENPVYAEVQESVTDTVTHWMLLPPPPVVAR